MNLDKMAMRDAKLVVRISDRIIKQTERTPGYDKLVDAAIERVAAATVKPKTQSPSTAKVLVVGAVAGVVVYRYLDRRNRQIVN